MLLLLVFPVQSPCSADVGRQWRVAERLDYGMIGVNQVPNIKNCVCLYSLERV